MIINQNNLKFLINEESNLIKSDHQGQICEAYHSTEKTWYAALIQDIDEASQEAEIAWIGFNKQEKGVKKCFITLLTALNPADLFVGAQCNSVRQSNGMWFPCQIEREIVPSAEDEQQMLETGDFRLL